MILPFKGQEKRLLERGGGFGMAFLLMRGVVFATVVGLGSGVVVTRALVVGAFKDFDAVVRLLVLGSFSRCPGIRGKRLV